MVVEKEGTFRLASDMLMDAEPPRICVGSTRQDTVESTYDRDFASSPTSSPAITRQNSADLSDGTTLAPSSPPSLVKADADASSSPRTSDVAPPKKFKITAWNGWQVKLRPPTRERVKREVTLTDDDMGGGIGNGSESSGNSVATSLRRHNSRAKLAMLPSLPLDILFEVFSHLRPLDLLHIARTTKGLRALLLHRSATSVWKGALASVPSLPPCPDDVSLPSWVNLVFDTHCQNCLTRNAKSVDFLLRVRLCSKCVKIKLSPESLYDNNTKLGAIIVRAVAFSDWNNRGTKYCTVQEKETFLKALDSHPGDRSAFVEERRALIKARSEHAARCKKWLDSIVEEREAELEEIRWERNKKIRQKLGELGFAEELLFLEKMRYGICAVRPWPNIIDFDYHPDVKQPKPLTDRVWSNMKDDMIDYMHLARSFHLQNLRCLLVRKRRLAIYTAYFKWRLRPENLARYPSDQLMPGPADVLEWKKAKELANRIDDADLTKEDIKDLLYALPKFIKDWRKDAIESLWHLTLNRTARPELGFTSLLVNNHQESQERVLKLAATVFRCTNKSVHWRYHDKWLVDEGVVSPASLNLLNDREAAREPCMWYPEFLFHPCCSVISQPYDECRADENAFLRVNNEYRNCRRSAWCSGGGGDGGGDDEDAGGALEFDEKASKAVRNLLDACGGLDYTTTTVEEMDGLDARFVCLKCTFGAKCDGTRKVRVWSWRDAVQHCLKSHFGDARVAWERVSCEDTAKAKALEAEEHTKRNYLPPQELKLWKCIRCRDTANDCGRLTWAGLKKHFGANPKHGNKDEMEGKEGVLYYKALDFSPRELPPVKMIPGKVDEK